MPRLTVRTINSVYDAETVLEDVQDAEAALAHGVRGAMMIAADELEQAANVCAIEVIVEDEAGAQLRRCAVSVSVAPLLPRG